MKLILTGLSLALAGTSTVAAAQAYGTLPTVNGQPVAQKQPEQAADNAIQPSPKALKAITELQTAVNAKDTANIPAKLAAAQAVAKTKEDHYWIARMQLKAAADRNDAAGVTAAIEAIAATSLMPAAELGSLYGALGSTEFNGKQYAAAAAAFEHQIALDPHNVDAIVNLAQTRVAVGNRSEAVNALERAIKARSAAGVKPEEALYKQAVSVAYAGKLPQAMDLAREWVSAYPGPESWHNAIAIYRNRTNQDTEGSLDLLRLMEATKAMKVPLDYQLFAEGSLEQMNYNQAQAVIDAGIAAKIVDPTSTQFSDIIAALKAKKKPTAAELDAAMKASPTAANMLRNGDRYYAMGDFTKAADAYRKTIAKGGIDPGIANLHLGMALAQAGDKDAAISALKGVTGPRAELAKLWLIYVQHHA